MSRTIYKMHLESIQDLTPNVRELKLKCTDEQKFKFRAGQFAMLHVPLEGQPKPALRAYSIASTHADDTGFTLLFKYVDNGVASKFVWSLKGNEILEFTGPFGKVFFKEPPTEQIVFLNTGTGLSQHFCYLQSFAKLYPHLKYRLLFGVRTESEIYYQKELSALQKNLSDFKFEYILSRPSESWSGRKGYIQNFISDFNYIQTPTTFYLCGNNAMIKDTLQILDSQGFDKNFVHKEAFD